jgi:hypothetical protein
MSSTTSSSNLTSGFIDLATFDEAEKYLYGGAQAVSYFVRKVRKSTWFTVVPVVLSKSQGTANFNQTWSANISRAGDYLLRAWLRVTIPSVTVSTTGQFGTSGRLRWTRNLMHNLIQECNISFNDLVEMRFDNWYLDFWAAFTIPAGKRNGYQNMIGNFEELTNPLAVSLSGTTLPSVTLNLPLPICHARDTGVSLPTAALPYNEMKLNFVFRNWTQLLIVDNCAVAVPGVAGVASAPATLADIAGGQPPVLTQVDVWAEYAIVSNAERKQMGKAPRDMLIEQVQTSPNSFNAVNNTYSTDIRFSHPVKTLFFAVQNTTNAAEWSNYTTASPVPTPTGVNFSPNFSADPVLTATLLYENTQRLSNMGADYFSLIVPWYSAVSIPLETGYHCYDYTLDMLNVNPLGSTNYGKLTNVSFQIVPSALAQAGANASATFTTSNPDPVNYANGFATRQTYNFIVVAVNHNIVRISGGAQYKKNPGHQQQAAFQVTNILGEVNSVNICQCVA